MMNKFIIGVVGNPNCGKTTLFNALTGARQRIGNWPGVTVDRKSGNYNYNDQLIEVVDLPGIYSLSASSLDEEVARDYILSGEPDLIVNIIDASNLDRNLYLTVQLLEMKTPLIIALNMMDIALDNKIKIDIAAFAKKLGCPVVPLTATRGKGVEDLKASVNQVAGNPVTPQTRIIYPAEIQDAVKKLSPIVKKALTGQNIDTNWAAIKLLEEEELITDMVGPGVADILAAENQKIEEKLGDEADIIIADSRYEMISGITGDTVKKGDRLTGSITGKIDKIVLNRAFGIPFFLAAMYLMFMITINLGGAFIDFFDIFTGTIFVDGFGALLASFGSPEWLITILAGGVGGGIQTIATFIPPIGFMFLSLSFLEDSGYMARAAFVMDRFMRLIGLPGKSFVPMLVGFGCNVPAIMATRTLESPRDRILTIMMNPFMSCGARLPVYALFAAAFFPKGGQNLVFGLYLVGIGFAMITGLALKNSLLPGETTPFIMELPPYHMPTVKGVIFRAADRLKTFIIRAGMIIIPIVVILSFLNSLGTDGSFGNDDSDRSALSYIGKSITPVFSPMGITQENWPATVGIFTGIFAKEAVVGTLDAMYSQLDQKASGKDEAEEEFSFWGGIKESFITIPENLGGVAGSLFDPLGLSVGDISTVETAAQEQEVTMVTFGSMVRLFDGKIGAFAYLLFILLYFPCVAAIAAVYRETNIKWTLFSGLWTTGLAYMAATIFYQIATISRHPVTSLLWTVSMAGLFLLSIILMRYLGQTKIKSNLNLLNAQV